MGQKMDRKIVIKGARVNNLKDVHLEIPHHKFIVVTGISGSGKSSLVFDLLVKEGQRRYFETLPSFARQYLGKLNRPEVDLIEGLSPVIAIGQSTTGMQARSTVGTMSDIYDYFRLLFARAGKSDRPIQLSRSLFSFNSERGKCSQCNGIGKEEKINLNKLIAYPERTIREGALAPTLPTGYIMYSQVTIDVLNQVCEAEGFNVDIPWNELTESQKNVVLYGSEKIKVPFGKHSLESRLKWTGIKAKPREEGYYKGMIPIMSDILRRDRNANILKYVHSVKCSKCNGARLSQDALSVRVRDKSIYELACLELSALLDWINEYEWNDVANSVIEKIRTPLAILIDLGLGHLQLNRSAKSLSPSEIQRIRIANQLSVSLSDILYVFDEPSIGLHPEENKQMIAYFRKLVSKGNTVIVVEHDLETISAAEHIIEVGPKAGEFGGEIIFNGSVKAFLSNEDLSGTSATFRALKASFASRNDITESYKQQLMLKGCFERNLQHIDVSFQLGKLNVVSGKSGAGKTSLIKDCLLKVAQAHLGEAPDGEIKVNSVEHIEAVDKLVFIDHTPIGRTPRSNPATYLGLSDHIRDLFASLPMAKEKGFTKSRFSFNNKGGRCETCQGAGKIQIGMHFLGNVELVCETCNGRRFNDETLSVQYKDYSIADIYRLSVDEAIAFFDGQKKILTGLKLLSEIGLGYLKLGQSSTTLSGGEAQRIKIANQLQKKDTGNTLYILIEPSIGLHKENIQSLLPLFERVLQKGNTIVCLEQDAEVISWSDWHIELGPGSGKNGGKILHEGPPKLPSGKGLSELKAVKNSFNYPTVIELNGIQTHLLKDIDIRIPKQQLTVVTGLSGSGKSSLVYDTLFSEANAQFSESLSAYSRSFIRQNNRASIRSHQGLSPAIGINRNGSAFSDRSTVGTLSGVYDALRLLYSRIAQYQGEEYTAQHFSFNQHLGACPKCKGLGKYPETDADKLIINPEKPLLDGATSSNKALQYYVDPNGQFMATLRAVAAFHQWNIDIPWNELTPEVQRIILFGTGDQEWDVTWEYKTKARSGSQHLSTKWRGLCHYIFEEYERKLHNKNIQHLEDLLHYVECDHCHGSRLKPKLLKIQFLGFNIHELSKQSIATILQSFNRLSNEKDTTIKALAQSVTDAIRPALNMLSSLGLSYLSLDRAITSLSGGERQRVSLTGQLSSHLHGVVYVLDEPTVGLDQAQTKELLNALRSLIDNGNTVVIVEHDPDFIKHSDYIIELGPAAGKNGGTLIFQGPHKLLSHHKQSLTYRLLNESSAKSTKKERILGQPFSISGAIANNLKSVDVTFQSGMITAVTGVSGSGKSSLIRDTLFASWKKRRPIKCTAIDGIEQFDDVLFIDQEALQKNRLSTPASLTNVLESLKKMFAQTAEAKERKLKRSDFSYQSKNGKCTSCSGYGETKVAMDFMSDIWLTCESCKGLRFNETILASPYRDKSIGEILQMTVEEALIFFQDSPLTKTLQLMQSAGLGHLVLGQSGHTLSGGEAQRLKLIIALQDSSQGKRLFLFDEPGTGLHPFDIDQLFEVFDTIVEQGDTIVFIEHNSRFIKRADHVIKLGPGAGVEGGQIIL